MAIFPGKPLDALTEIDGEIAKLAVARRVAKFRAAESEHRTDLRRVAELTADLDDLLDRLEGQQR